MRRIAFTAALAVMCGLAPSASAAGKTFVVNDSGFEEDAKPGNGKCDSDPDVHVDTCTLAAAMAEANDTPEKDKIHFAIPGAGTHTITVENSQHLPFITAPVVIDGYTQPGASPNTVGPVGSGSNAVILISIVGPNNGSVFNVRSPSTIRGLAIRGAASAGIDVDYTWDVHIEGNFIGTYVAGTTADPNHFGIQLNFCDSCVIGGTDPAARNIVAGNHSIGIIVYGKRSRVEGNLVGVQADGTSALGNGVSSGGSGVFVGGKRSTVQGNVIANNTHSGVTVSGADLTAAGNRILSNSIYANTLLGIDLDGGTENGAGVTASDGDDPMTTTKIDPDTDVGPNRLQNTPVLVSAHNFPSFTQITGTIDSQRSTNRKRHTYLIQLFRNATADASGYGEGKTFIGQAEVTTDNAGHAAFSFAKDPKVTLGEYVTATATDVSSGDTSEFGNAQVVEDPPISP